MQILAERGVRIGAHLLQVGSAIDEPFDALDLAQGPARHLQEQLDALADGRTFPVINERAAYDMLDQICAAQAGEDSVGGFIECVACGMPAGVGGPMFDGIESAIARLAFGIPAVKSLEFGAGARVSTMHGNKNNDPFVVRDGVIAPLTNNAGGNLGGITTGAPVLFRMAVKPTPSISQSQRSVNLSTGEPEKLRIHGRHDPCIAPRAVPVAEAIMALALLDSWLAFPPQTA
jgi:chorismate synthase